jgi:hypothetical protein
MFVLERGSAEGMEAGNSDQWVRLGDAKVFACPAHAPKGEEWKPALPGDLPAWAAGAKPRREALEAFTGPSRKAGCIFCGMKSRPATVWRGRRPLQADLWVALCAPHDRALNISEKAAAADAQMAARGEGLMRVPLGAIEKMPRDLRRRLRDCYACNPRGHVPLREVLALARDRKGRPE